MSTFYIKVEDGAPVGDPLPKSSAQTLGYFENDLRDGSIPEGLERFQPVPQPTCYFPKTVESDGELHKIDNVWQRVYQVRDMNAEELAAHKADTVANWLAGNCAYPSWSYNEETGQMSPPVHPDPEKGRCEWDEDTQSWTYLDA